MAPSIDEFEDLTQFADESFDTGEVDLFEFADDEDSPLLRLKSIVLSLDWDITEEILNELNEELASLRNLWKDDKVAQIYLQGMENVGKYMRTEGAYAHPNAIKLLLTLYHNFEKIISSANISGESVTSMLKADIRKFKVLQYQISALKKAKGDQEPPVAEDEEVQQESKSVPPQAAKEKKTAKSGAAAAPPPPPAKKKESGMSVPLRSMEATILGLEWEVTDEGLEKFSTEAAELRKHLSDNKEAQVLIQGLQALGAYIRAEKIESHPDAFTILHSFYDALKMLLDSPDLGAAQRRQILIEQISSLNSLKEVIARSAASKPAEEGEDEQEEEPEDEEVPAPAAEADEEPEEFAFGDEEEDDFSVKAEEASAPVAAPAAKPKAAMPLASLQPTETSSEEDDEFDDDLFAQDGGGVKPALADEDEDGSFAGSLTSEELSGDKAVELDEKLDSFFNFGDEEEQPQKSVKAAKVPVQPEEKKPAAEVKKPEKLSLDNLLETDDKDEDAEEEEDDDIDSSFFNFTDDDESSGVAGATAAAAADSLHFDDELFDGPTKQAVSADEEENQGLAAVSKEEEEDNDDELDAFFNFDDELDDKAAPPSARPVAAALADEEESPLGLSANIFGGVDEDGPELEQADDTQPALADEDEEPDDEAADVADSDEISDGLDSFFSFDDEDDKKADSPAAQPAVSEPALADEEENPLSLSAGLFGGVDEDGPELEQADDTQPALADEDEETDNEVADSDEISDGLDSFFSFDDEDDKKADSLAAQPSVSEPALADDEEESPLSRSAGLFGGVDEDGPELEQADDTQPALADEDEEPGDEAADSDEIADGLDSFFSFDEDDEKADSPAAQPAVSEPALADDEEESPLSLSAGLLSMEERNEPAVAIEDAEADIDTARAAEIKNKLDTLFSFENEVPSAEDEQAAGESFTEELPELADELITPLDDDAPGSGDTLFGADAADSKADAQQQDEEFFAFGSSDADDETAAALPGAFAEESEEESDDALADADEQHDAFFGFDGNLDPEAEEEEPVAADDEDSALFAEEADADLLAAADSKSDEPQEEFFAFSDTESEEELPAAEEEATSAALLADDEQDELFSLKMEEEPAEEAAGGSEPEDDLLLGEEYEEQSGTALLFGQDSLADPFASVEEKDEADNIVGPEERADEVDVAEIFSSLAAVAAALPSTPSQHHLRQVSELAAAARSSSSLPPHQAIVLDLLDTSSALLAKAPQTAASAAIVQELAAGLNKAEEPSALAELISQYTSWQKNFFSQILHGGQHEEDADGHVPPQTLAQLRQEMREEFRQLRQEMLTLRR
ncbi:hypothetical protein [Candidatus Electronema sp. JM]|uniref:hypothetical protein n=1 Tax=Candidatus Electronema sp. JM TaxID=3401571 RepID=UPI003AA7BCA5